MGKFLKPESVSSSLDGGGQQFPRRRAVVSFSIVRLATSCLALSKCLINTKRCCHHHYHHIFVTRASPEASPQLAPAAAPLRTLDAQLAVPRPVSSSKAQAQQPQQGPGFRSMPPARGLAEQWPWCPALTLGPGSPVSGGHPSAGAPPARSGARGRRSPAAPQPAGRGSKTLAGAEEEQRRGRPSFLTAICGHVCSDSTGRGSLQGRRLEWEPA